MHDVCTGLEVILLLMESSLLHSFGTERAKHGHCSAVVNLRSVKFGRPRSRRHTPMKYEKKSSQIYGPIKMQSSTG